MEANKDSALHYIELAERAILDNDNQRALRYLKKSEDLFPTQKAKGLSNFFSTSILSRYSFSEKRSNRTINVHQFSFKFI